MADEHDSRINDINYWNLRFAHDWESSAGQAQSRFFSAIAVRLFPRWLLPWLRAPGRSFCDWGCAMGAGTDELKQQLGVDGISGIDFSDVAIARAAETYPDIDFKAIDLLNENDGVVYDVVFSSNTLEHFEAPWAVCRTLAAYARHAMVFLVPFEEDPGARHPEHFYSFEWNNLERSIAGRFRLVDVSTIDASTLPNPQWGGRQILLTYISDDLAEHLSDAIAATGQDLLGKIGVLDGECEALSTARSIDRAALDDVQARLEQVSSIRDSYESRLVAWEARGAELDSQVAELVQRCTSYEQRLIAWDARGKELDSAIAELTQRSSGYEQRLVAWDARGRELDDHIVELTERSKGYEQRLIAWEARGRELDAQVADLIAELKRVEAARDVDRTTLSAWEEHGRRLNARVAEWIDAPQFGDTALQCSEAGTEASITTAGEASCAAEVLIRMIEQRGNRIAEMDAQLKGLLNSRSWRLTAGLRRLSALLRYR